MEKSKTNKQYKVVGYVADKREPEEIILPKLGKKTIFKMVSCQELPAEASLVYVFRNVADFIDGKRKFLTATADTIRIYQTEDKYLIQPETLK